MGRTASAKACVGRKPECPRGGPGGDSSECRCRITAQKGRGLVGAQSVRDSHALVRSVDSLLYATRSLEMTRPEANNKIWLLNNALPRARNDIETS